MNRAHAMVACLSLAALASPAFAGADLCRHELVQEVARIDHELKPVKEIARIAMNPQGFALKQVSEHLIHIPPWVGYALDPRGAIRAKVMDFARDHAKAALGLESNCAAPADPVREEA